MSKIWKYFLVNDISMQLDNPYHNGSRSHSLYAYTNKKKYAKEFEAARDMDIFEKIVDNDDTTWDEINELYPMAKLKERRFVTKIERKGVYDYILFPFIATDYEYSTVTEETSNPIIIELISEGYWENTTPLVYIKDPVVYRGLKLLGYELVPLFFQDLPFGPRDLNFNITIDEMELFMEIFNLTLKVD